MATLSELTSRRVFVGLVLVSLVLLALVVKPFATSLFVAAVLAGFLAPLHRRMTKRLRKPQLAAALLVIGAMLVVLAPIGGLTAYAVKEASDGYQYVTQTVRSEGMSGLISKLPDRVERPVRQGIERFSVTREDADTQLQNQSANAAKAVTGAAAATGKFLLHAALMLVALYFLLLEGGTLIAWLEKHAPLKPGQTYELMLEFRKVSVAVITSTVVTAAVQTAVATIGYLIARVPYALFFAAITFFVALVPAIGAAVVCLVAALLLLATGHSMAALFLAIWGVAVVGLVDNIVKPMLAKRGLEMHGAIVFFALLGGIAAFGPVGLLLGPMAVSFFLALVKIHERDYQRRLPPEERDEPVKAPRIDLARKADALDDEGQVPQPS